MQPTDQTQENAGTDNPIVQIFSMSKDSEDELASSPALRSGRINSDRFNCHPSTHIESKPQAMYGSIMENIDEKHSEHNHFMID
jgi:hypothetical protein